VYIQDHNISMLSCACIFGWQMYHVTRYRVENQVHVLRIGTGSGGVNNINHLLCFTQARKFTRNLFFHKTFQPHYRGLLQWQ